MIRRKPAWTKQKQGLDAILESLRFRPDWPNPPEPAQARIARLSRRFLSATPKKRGASVESAVVQALTKTRGAA